MTKKPKHNHLPSTDPSLTSLHDKITTTTTQSLHLLINQMHNSTDRIYQSLYGEHWRTGKELELEKLTRLQTQEASLQREVEESAAVRKERAKVDLRGSGVFKDDRDPRY